MKNKKELIILLSTVVGSMLLLLPAIYNGYPLVNSDDGTYMGSGFKMERPGDRPITYGLFLRAFSLDGFSMWIAVFAQAAVLSWLLIKILQRACGEKQLMRNSIIMFVLLALTSASWTVSEILPDIWAAISLLCLALIIAGKEKLGTTAFLYLVYFCSVATHMSNLMIFTGLLVVFFLFRRWFFEKPELRKLNLRILTLLVLTWCTFVTMSFSYSKSKHVFMMASMAEKGILKKYLDDNCRDKQYGICKYKDEMSYDPNVFIWDNNSPIYQQGGWDATKEEYASITNDILTEPKYAGMFLQQSIASSWRQLFVFHLAEGNFPFPEGTHVYSGIKEHVPNDTTIYRNAWQHEANIVERLSAMNNINYFLTALGLLVLIFSLLFSRKYLGTATKLFIFLFITAFIINIWDCATFAQVNARYGSRMVWLIPLAGLLCIISISYNKHSHLFKSNLSSSVTDSFPKTRM